MFIKSALITIKIPDSSSLKYKRSVIKSIVDSTQNKFSISFGEIDYLDKHNMSSVGFSIISNQRKHLAEKEQAIIQFIELKLLGRGEIMNIIYDENKI